MAMRWYKPALAKRLIPLLAKNLLCRPAAQDIDNSIATDTLAELGDENTILMLQKMAAERTGTDCSMAEREGAGWAMTMNARRAIIGTWASAKRAMCLRTWRR